MTTAGHNRGPSATVKSHRVLDTQQDENQDVQAEEPRHRASCSLGEPARRHRPPDEHRHDDDEAGEGGGDRPRVACSVSYAGRGSGPIRGAGGARSVEANSSPQRRPSATMVPMAMEFTTLKTTGTTSPIRRVPGNGPGLSLSRTTRP